MKKLIIIPARAGSKGVPKKNIKSNYLDSFNDINILENNNNSITFDNVVDSNNIIAKSDLLTIGCKVFHQKFGYGTITNIEGENAEVEFSKTNTKKVKKEFLATDV